MTDAVLALTREAHPINCRLGVPGIVPPIRVLLPRSLRTYWDAPGEVEIDAETVGLALHALGEKHPGLAARILDEQGALRPYVHVFVNEQAVDSSGLERVQLRAGDTVRVLPSVAGG